MLHTLISNLRGCDIEFQIAQKHNAASEIKLVITTYQISNKLKTLNESWIFITIGANLII